MLFCIIFFFTKLTRQLFFKSKLSFEICSLRFFFKILNCRKFSYHLTPKSDPIAIHSQLNKETYS